MENIKVFRVVGEIRKPNYKTSFKKEVRALKPEHAVERIHAELGSQHRVKRNHLRILSVEEIRPEEAESPIIRELSGVED